MILTTEKGLKRDACEMFRLVQAYMGDRKLKSGQTTEAIALDITTRGWAKSPLRDEIYIQICRQTTDNPRRESVLLGWELIAICVYFFPPSEKFQPYLESYIRRHVDDEGAGPEGHYAQVCSKRLERMARCGLRKGLKKPTLEEIEQARIQIFRPSMFGNTLEEIVGLQRGRFPNRKLPWIQTTLSDAVLRLGGTSTEGIFRVPGDIDEVNSLKARMDQWEEVDATDPHVPASLLKLWYRELYEPLIPHDLYEASVEACNDPAAAVAIVARLSPLNQLVLTYLIHFLQLFSQEGNVVATKMDANNLAMVMAPNCLRCMSDDPRVIFENTRKEMAFLRLLIEHLDTSSVAGLS
ncbi:ARHGAP39 [Cordylochernes scorpioides]|uniref:ARHGAP39 n=1 Tax=Cordylochernes scorpioides TaxID=51811 RepID=A0ABY6KES4_9ARAC|nr:ARHGAP39 [Cordylochernes scorpioides]